MEKLTKYVVPSKVVELLTYIGPNEQPQRTLVPLDIPVYLNALEASLLKQRGYNISIQSEETTDEQS